MATLIPQLPVELSPRDESRHTAPFAVGGTPAVVNAPAPTRAQVFVLRFRSIPARVAPRPYAHLPAPTAVAAGAAFARHRAGTERPTPCGDWRRTARHGMSRSHALSRLAVHADRHSSRAPRPSSRPTVDGPTRTLPCEPSGTGRGTRSNVVRPIATTGRLLADPPVATGLRQASTGASAAQTRSTNSLPSLTTSRS